MAKKQAQTYESIMSELRKGHYAPVYLLMGDEPYYIDQMEEYIMEHAILPEERDFNLTVTYGLDTNAQRVAEAAMGYPMMAERQVVVVREAQNIKQWEPLETYLDHPMPTTVLVLCYKNGTMDKRRRLVKQAENVGVVLESKKKSDRDLVPFIEAYVREKGATADVKAVHMIKDHVGADLSRLTSEIDKVLLSLPADKKHITPEVVEDRVGVSKEYNIFELRDAIVRKDVLKANRIIQYFDANPKAGSIYAILPNIFSFFQNLMIAYYAPAPRGEREVAQHLELRGEWQAREYVTAMRAYSGRKTMEILAKIREVDARSKGLDNQNTAPGELLKELMFVIMH